MNKEDIKIKYVIGSFRDELEYPTLEDFNYLINYWYFFEGGKHFIHEYRGIAETGNIIFPDNILKEKLNGDEEVTKNLLDSLLSQGKISINKTTKFTTYWEIL
jgi:hypothetical protein